MKPPLFVQYRAKTEGGSRAETWDALEWPDPVEGRYALQLVEQRLLQNLREIWPEVGYDSVTVLMWRRFEPPE
jgi:hypothetical protein